MKKIQFILFLLIALSCSKDNAKDSKTIIGTWKSVSFTSNVPIDYNEDGIKNTDFTKEIQGCYEHTFYFLSNGSLKMETKEAPRADFGKYVNVNVCESHVLDGTWEINDSSTKLFIEFTDGFYYSASMNRLADPLSIDITLENDKLILAEFPNEYWDDLICKIELKKQ